MLVFLVSAAVGSKTKHILKTLAAQCGDSIECQCKGRGSSDRPIAKISMSCATTKECTCEEGFTLQGRYTQFCVPPKSDALQAHEDWIAAGKPITEEDRSECLANDSCKSEWTAKLQRFNSHRIQSMAKAQKELDLLEARVADNPDLQRKYGSRIAQFNHVLNTSRDEQEEEYFDLFLTNNRDRAGRKLKRNEHKRSVSPTCVCPPGQEVPFASCPWTAPQLLSSTCMCPQ